jgi:mRNA-degrading endonuclease toxin of MazEF toxin-antitoxin module
MKGKKRFHSADIDLVAQYDSEVEQYRSIADSKLREYFSLYDFTKYDYQHKDNDDNTLENLVDAALALQMAKNNILDYVERIGINVTKFRSFSIEYKQYYQKSKNYDSLLESCDGEVDKIRNLNDGKLQEAITTFEKSRVAYVSSINNARSPFGNVDISDVDKARTALIIATDAVKKRAGDIGVYIVKEKSLAI